MLPGAARRPHAVIAVLDVRLPSRDGSRQLADGLDAALRSVCDVAETLLAETVDEALAHLAEVPQVAAVIMHVPLTGDAGEGLERIRERHPLIPILALVERGADLARVQQLKCESCELPANARQIRHFVLRAQAFQRLQKAWRSWLVEYGAKTYGLSSRAIGLLTQAVNNAAPGLLMAELGVSHHTLLSQVSRLLTPRSDLTEIARADDLLARLLAQTSLREWDRQRADEAAAATAEPGFRH